LAIEYNPEVFEDEVPIQDSGPRSNFTNMMEQELKVPTEDQAQTGGFFITEN